MRHEDILAQKQSYLRELESYRELKGVNILKMFGHCIQFEKNRTEFMIITEFMSKGSLANVLKNEPNLSYRQKFWIAYDIAAGMARIHKQNFIHRDIRPDNVLIDGDYNAKIADMGLAKFFNKSNRNTFGLGCRAYMPPEFNSGKYDHKLDIFTFGLTLNQLFGGSHDYKDPIVITHRAVFLWEVIDKCISREPKNRPTAHEILKTFFIIKKVSGFVLKSKYYSNYASMPTCKKNQIFEYVYKTLLNKSLLVKFSKLASSQSVYENIHSF